MRAAEQIVRARWLILAVAIGLLFLSLSATQGIKVSTKLEALMPEGAPSVQTLNDAMEKAGSFSSIQIVVHGEDKKRVEETLFVLEAVTRPLLWSESVQYFEDISVLERHKLLMLTVPELEKVEKVLEKEVMTAATDDFEEKTGIPLSITLLDAGQSNASAGGIDNEFSEETIKSRLFDDVETERRFVSDDGETQALVIWPKPGHEGLAEAKAMVSDVAAIINALDLNAPEDGLHVGIAGRIRNKVSQFDAVIRDVVVGLGSSISMIITLLLFHYRRIVVVPLIILPLITGIIWTVGLTSVVIGGLNLITIFLALILFGLGIDFGIHNFSRYSETRAKGASHVDAIAVIMGQTGRASLVAGVTTAIGFLSLLFTEFRAFREFGFIAGSGILLIFTAMYTVFPAFLSVVEKHIDWMKYKKRENRKLAKILTIGSRYPRGTILAILPLVFVAALLAPQMTFEKNFKNIQAARTDEHLWATKQSKNIFKGGHDRAVLVVESLEDVKAIEEYFEEYAKKDTDSPTIAKLTSVRNFVPDASEQKERLQVIKRMWDKIEESGPLPEELADKTKYLDIDMLKATDLSPTMQRLFLGTENRPGYLMYIYNSVTMDDADLARQFYDDAAEFTVEGKTYNPASEGFIFVEMLALMKADAAKAVGLVGGVTILIILGFVRSARAAAVVLTPTALVLLFTIAIMALVELPLSIINMVILPSLIGISVDNGVHIFERLRETGEDIETVMAGTGRAASITTLTTLLGFGGLITASMGGLRSMGMLALIGFGVCLLLTWLLLPALIRLYELRQHKLVAAEKPGIGE
ncbi:MAG: RND family transporter [Kordiimonas sp.]